MSRNRVIGGFEDAIERGQQTVKSATLQTVSDFASSTKGQITGVQSPAVSNPNLAQGTNEQAASSQAPAQQQQKTDVERVEFLKALYGKSDSSSSQKKDQSKPNNSGSVTQALGIPQKDPDAGKTPEEIAKLQALKNQLHQEYYQDLVNRPKPKEEPVAEKLEREEQEEKMSEIEEQKKKPAPLPATVKRGTGENVVGVSG